MRSFFDPESFYWKPFGWFCDLLILSLLWLVCSLPLITLGAATTALYDCTAHGFRYKERAYIGRFFRTFKAEFKLGTLSGLLWGVLWIGLYRLLGLLAGVGPLPWAAGLVLLVLLTGFIGWVFPLLSRFEFDFKGLNATALKLAMARLPATLLLALSTAGAVWLCLRFILPIFVMPALLALIWTLPIERAFRQYMPEDEE